MIALNKLNLVIHGYGTLVLGSSLYLFCLKKYFFWCGLPLLAAFIFLFLFMPSSGPYFHQVFR